MADLPQDVRQLIRDLCRGPENNMGPLHPEPSWGIPLVGFCRGDDAVFQELKDAVGPFHWTPLEAFFLAFPEKEAPESKELAVVSWILPQSVQTRTDNARQTKFPAERWVRSRVFGEEFNDGLARRLASQLKAWGVDAVIPTALPGFSSVLEGPYGRSSCWSHRHIAYAAGLGTFGLCDGLITSAGKAMRTGSLVARFPVDPVSRPYQDHHAYCLHYAKGTCGNCVPRCPVGAISKKNGHDKVRCSAYAAEEMREHSTTAYGFAGYACGLCQTAVPCSAGIPAQLQH